MAHTSRSLPSSSATLPASCSKGRRVASTKRPWLWTKLKARTGKGTGLGGNRTSSCLGQGLPCSVGVADYPPAAWPASWRRSWLHAVAAPPRAALGGLEAPVCLASELLCSHQLRPQNLELQQRMLEGLAGLPHMRPLSQEMQAGHLSAADGLLSLPLQTRSWPLPKRTRSVCSVSTCLLAAACSAPACSTAAASCREYPGIQQ